MNGRTLTILTAVVALAVVGAIFVMSNQNAGPAASLPTDGSFDLSEQPTLGDPDAPVEIVVFEDFKCPACGNFEENVFPRLESEFVDDSEANITFVNFPNPTGPDSVTVAIASECAFEQDQEAFWDFKSVAFRTQSEFATAASLARLAEQYVPALDSAALQTCIEEERFADRVQAERAMGIAAGVTGTPNVFVNGELVQGDFRSIRTAVEAALP